MFLHVCKETNGWRSGPNVSGEGRGGGGGVL